MLGFNVFDVLSNANCSFETRLTCCTARASVCLEVLQIIAHPARILLHLKVVGVDVPDVRSGTDEFFQLIPDGFEFVLDVADGNAMRKRPVSS